MNSTDAAFFFFAYVMPGVIIGNYVYVRFTLNGSEPDDARRAILCGVFWPVLMFIWGILCLADAWSPFIRRVALFLGLPARWYLKRRQQ